MKRFFISLLTCFTITSLACWFTEGDFNKDYIAGANNYFSHYTAASTFDEAIYNNDYYIALPLTVFVKVAPISESYGKEILLTKAILQYKKAGSTTWIDVKTVSGVKLKYDVPVAIFGRNIEIDEKDPLAKDDVFFIRVYLTDGTSETGDLNSDIDENLVTSVMDRNSGDLGGGWTAPFVFRLQFNGNRRPSN